MGRSTQILACIAAAAAAAQAQSGANLVQDPGFEAAFAAAGGIATPGQWKVSESIAPSKCAAGAHGGAQAISFTALDDGTFLQQILTTQLKTDTPYLWSAWVYLPATTKCVLGPDNLFCPFGVLNVDGAGQASTSLLSANPGAWNRITGAVYLNKYHGNGIVSFGIGGLVPGETLCFDDASLTSSTLADFRTISDAKISMLRQRDVTVKFGSATGTAEPVRVQQTKLAFPLGSALNTGAFDNQRYLDFFAANFNFCTDEYGMAIAFDQARDFGAPYTTQVLDYCEKLGLKTRGHCADGELQDWYSDEKYFFPLPRDGSVGSIQQIAYDRLIKWMTTYSNRTVDIEPINEMVNGRFWPTILPCGATGPCICDYKPACPDAMFPDKKIPIRAWAQKMAKALAPDKTMYINEYCSLSTCSPEQSNPSTMIKFINFLNANSGNAVGGFSDQAHMQNGNSLSGEDVLIKFETLSQNLPALKFWAAELDVDDPDEAARANGYEMMYRALFASPQIEGIVLWGFWKPFQWRTYSYVVNQDWSLNAAGERLFGANGLISTQWRSKAAGTTAAAGPITLVLRAFHGDYTAYYGAGDRCTAKFSVPVGATAITVPVGAWTCTSGSPPSA